LIFFAFSSAAQTSAETVVKAEKLSRYAGRYEHALQTWEFFVRDEKLFVRQDGKEFELKNIGKTLSVTSRANFFSSRRRKANSNIFLWACTRRGNFSESFGFEKRFFQCDSSGKLKKVCGVKPYQSKLRL
jgi:hypothetical protein